MRDELKKLYTFLNDEKMKKFHEYKVESKLGGINIYPSNGNSIYVLDSLIRKILEFNSNACMYVDFEYKYLRLL